MEQNRPFGPLIEILVQAEKVTALTGAGISAESGVPTFRGEDGLWKQYRAEQLATPQAFTANPHLVWEWYDWRRDMMGSKNFNPGHQVIAKWETRFPAFHLITQNIDGLHKKAGSHNILELHGNIWKMRCTAEGTVVENTDIPLKENPPMCASCGAMLRPHVVWFGESLDMAVINEAFRLSADCEVMFVVGTSAFVQPAASLPIAAREAGAKIVEINPGVTPLTDYADFSFRGKSGEILPLIDRELTAVLDERKV